MSAALVRAAPVTPADLRTCRRWIAHHSRSFYLSSLLLPREVRVRAWALYAFCRRADDAVDAVGPAGGPGEDQAALGRVAGLRARLQRVYAGEVGAGPAEAIDRAFSVVAAEAHLPEALPLRLLAGMEADTRPVRYESWDQLLGYCFDVAATVGLMMTAVMGHRMGEARHGEVMLRAADLGVAMQLTNIARDVGEDARRGRVYLPEELLRRAGTSPDEVIELAARAAAPPDRLRAAVAELLRRAAAHYAAADQGLPMLPPSCQLAIRSARLIYAAIGDRLAARGHDSLTGRAVVPLRQKLWLVLRASAAGRPAPPADRTTGPADALLRRLCAEVGVLS